jgi:threonine dehydratase
MDVVITVTEAEIAAAVRLAAEESRLVVEPSGALTIAAVRFHRGELGVPAGSGTIVAVVSGGNVDPAAYRDYLVAPIPA